MSKFLTNYSFFFSHRYKTFEVCANTETAYFAAWTHLSKFSYAIWLMPMLKGAYEVLAFSDTITKREYINLHDIVDVNLIYKTINEKIS